MVIASNCTVYNWLYIINMSLACVWNGLFYMIGQTNYLYNYFVMSHPKKNIKLYVLISFRILLSYNLYGLQLAACTSSPITPLLSSDHITLVLRKKKWKIEHLIFRGDLVMDFCVFAFTVILHEIYITEGQIKNQNLFSAAFLFCIVAVEHVLYTYLSYKPSSIFIIVRL